MFWLAILLAILIVIIGIIIKENKYEQEVEETKKQLGIEDSNLVCKYGEIIGGNHPIIGTTRREVGLAVTKDNLIITTAPPIRIPLQYVKANVADKSTVSMMGIFLFGLMGLGTREKLLVLEIDDPVSRERYACVFRKIDFPEGIADIINKQRYALLTSQQVES